MVGRGQAPGEFEARILVVDDEPYIADLLATGLRFVGFDVRTAGGGLEALTLVRDWRPDLIVLDVMMPDVDGFEVTRRLRGEGRHTPVLFLTARDSVEDKVAGLTVGGDDYVTKPFSLEEVVARVRAVLRRNAPTDVDDSLLRYDDLVMDEDAHEVSRAGIPIELTPTEFSLLRYLMLNAGRVVSKAQILDHVWHYDFGGDGAVVESYISYLRRKVDAPFDTALIRTVRGVGYTLRQPQGAVSAGARTGA
jgi:two-component system OmpR family response regulator